MAYTPLRRWRVVSLRDGGVPVRHDLSISRFRSIFFPFFYPVSSEKTEKSTTWCDHARWRRSTRGWRIGFGVSSASHLFQWRFGHGCFVFARRVLWARISPDSFHLLVLVVLIPHRPFIDIYLSASQFVFGTRFVVCLSFAHAIAHSPYTLIPLCESRGLLHSLYMHFSPVLILTLEIPPFLESILICISLSPSLFLHSFSFTLYNVSLCLWEGRPVASLGFAPHIVI